MIAPNIAIPMVNAIALARSKSRERKRESGMIGSAARLSCQTNRTRSTTPATPSPTIVGEPQAYWFPPHVVSRIRAAIPLARSAGAEIVDPVPGRRHVQVEAERDDRERDGSDRHVDVEDPAPREVVDEEPAEQRPGHRRHGEDGPHQAHVPAASPRGDDVGEDRLCPDDEPAGAEPLDRAEDDQLEHRLREPGEHRAHQEDRDRGQEDGLAPEHVAELAVEGRGDGRGEEVGGHDPGEVVEAAELADDRRERRRDDRLVERRQEHAEHERDEHRRQRPSRQPLLRNLCREVVLAPLVTVASPRGAGRAAPA